MQASKSTTFGESQMMSQMSLQLQVLRLNSWPGGQVVFVTSGQGGSETHLQISMLLLNSSSGPQNLGKQVQLHVNKLKTLSFPAALVSLFTHCSCDPVGHLQKQNSSSPEGQGCTGGGHSHTQSSSFSILGGSQDKVHGVGLVDGGGVSVAMDVGVASGGGAVVLVGVVVTLVVGVGVGVASDGGVVVSGGGVVVAGVGVVVAGGGVVVVLVGDVVVLVVGTKVPVGGTTYIQCREDIGKKS